MMALGELADSSMFNAITLPAVGESPRPRLEDSL